MARVYASPVNFRDARGRWQKIDNRLVVRGGELVNRADDYRLQIPRELGPGSVRVSDPSGEVGLRLVGADGTGSVSGSRATFAGAMPGVAVTYQASHDQDKETLNLAGPKAPTRFVYRLQLGAGLEPKLNAGGGINVVDGTGRVRFSLLRPFMVDARARAGDVGRVSMRLVRSASGWRVVVSADRRWLAAPGRRWPVRVDPSLDVGSASDCLLDSATPDVSACGGPTDEVRGGSSPAYTLEHFDINGALPADSVVVDAMLWMYVDSSSGGGVPVAAYPLTRAFTSTATWDSYDGISSWDTPGGDIGSSPTDTQTVWGAQTYPGWDLSSVVRGWVDGSEPDYGVLLKAPSDGSDDVQFAGSADSDNPPFLQIDYQPRLGEPAGTTIVRKRLGDQTSLGVNVGNGNLLVEASDLQRPGPGMSEVLRRTYNSLTDVWGDGPHWLRGPFDESVGQVGNNGMLYAAADGQALLLQSDGNGGYTSPDGPVSKVVETFDPVHGFTGYRVTFRDGVTETFDTWALLSSQSDGAGHVITFNRDADHVLQSVTGTDGSTTVVSQDPDTGLLDSITDPTGRSLTYGYDPDTYQLTSVTDSDGGDTSYAYDESGNLVQITGADGKVTKFAYDDGRRVTAITDVTDQSAGTGSTTTFAYYDPTSAPYACGTSPSGAPAYGETVKTDPDGTETAYCYDTQDDVFSSNDTTPTPGPTLDPATVSPSWTGDSASISTDASELGPGIASVDLKASSGASLPPHSGGFQSLCTGTFGVACPTDSGPVTLNVDTTGMPEGTNTLQIAGIDGFGNETDEQLEVNVDRTAPSIALSGSLWDADNAAIGDSSYSLGVTAQDGSGSTPSSGIAQVSLTVDGTAVSGFSPATCAPGPCTTQGSWTLDGSAYPDGVHAIVISATDAAGNVSTKTITVTKGGTTTTYSYDADGRLTAVGGT